MVSTSDGNMLSLVMQQEDCNAPTMFQAIISYFIDIYLNDIIMYSNSLEDHLKHIKLIIDILKKEQFYLGKSKVYFLAKELKVLN